MSGWWDAVTDWGWTSWGSAAWSRDVVAAVEQAAEWIDAVATARRWGETWIDTAAGLVQTAAETAEGNEHGQKTDTVVFWEALLWGWEAEADGAPEGWDGLRATFASAIGTSHVEHVQRGDASATGVIGGASVETVRELGEMASDAGAWWDRWGWAVVLLLVLVLVAVLVVKLK